MTTQIDKFSELGPKGDTTQFNQTDVIKSLKSKQTNGEPSPASVEQSTKGRRGRKAKYATEEERIISRRQQQKAYRERKKKELNDLKALHEQYLAQNKPTE